MISGNNGVSAYTGNISGAFKLDRNWIRACRVKTFGLCPKCPASGVIRPIMQKDHTVCVKCAKARKAMESN